ncbi:DNA-binding protein [Caldinitratiruptor microaerophilus]|uniref:HTH LytTR-type domain-containing protein n=1 Tax=Caldinitratiruptor microaerophilus TaxID=671077 RepID=A0AA35CIS1_9FIRM|nr:DNA-binding protein [Caldinitratiruptor microaerophilus]BDG59113.1 hypothetical protein caldi_02030 [Caldinitratiruptor microaerophilus]
MLDERLLPSARPAPAHRLRALWRAREAFLASEPVRPPVRPVVLAAWMRSRQAGVDPARKEIPLVRPDGGVADDQAERLLRAGRPVVATAGELLRGTGHGVILADAQGVVLAVAGDRPLAAAAERVGCVPGATWEERLVGNNAIGTSLRLARPVRFAHAEHFCEGWGDWTCAAVPIRLPGEGAVIGSIDVSGYRTGASPRALVLAARLGRVIENLLAGPGSRATPPGAAGPRRPEGGSLPPSRLVDVPAPPGLVILRRGERRLLVRADQVYLFRASGGAVFALTDQGEFPAEADGLVTLEDRLAPYGFFRTDRAHLVNLNRVREVQPMFNRTLVLVLGNRTATEVPVSRRRAAALRELLGL